jgi:Subtilase family
VSIYRHLGWFIVAPCFVACGHADGDDTGREPALLTRAAAVVSPPTADDVCSSHRWVGVTLVGQCPGSVIVPGAGTWQQSWLTGSVPPTAPGLAKLCAYDWTPGSSATADPVPHVPALPGDAGRPASDWLARDCQVTAPLGGDAPPAKLGIDLNAQLLGQVDAPAERKANPAAAPARVQLAVLDTAPDSGTGPLISGRNGHGYALARLMENVMCPREPDGSSTGACLSQPEAVLAMPRVGPDEVDQKEGGHSGTPWELAAAITRTVDDFIERASQDAKSPPQRLVINLSLGWEPRWGGAFTSSPDELEGPVRAVYDALVHARCHGALAIAAAGNAPGGPETVDGAMFPARWETKLAPSATQCVAFEGGLGTMWSLPVRPFPDVGYRPLVHAVGGVDGADNVLRNARPKAMPRLAAPAALAAGVVPKGTVVGHPGGGSRVTNTAESTRVLTGTSVGAALASSAAATIWAYRPELTTSQVMQILADSGAELHQPPKHGLQTATCLGGGVCATAPRRLSICKAFEKACAGGSTRCPSVLPACSTTSPYAGEVSMPGPDALSSLEAACMPVLKVDGSSCDEVTESPDTQWFGTQVGPRLAPQPGDHHCPACFAVLDPRASTMNVLISIDPSTRAELSSPALLAYAERADAPVRIDLSSALRSTLVPGTNYRITHVPLRMPSASIARISSTRVSFRVLSDPAAGITRTPQSVTEEIPFYIR